MLAEKERLCSEHRDKRVFVETLRRHGSDSRLPASLRARLLETADSTDSERHWPSTAAHAQEVRHCLDAILQPIANSCEMRADLVPMSVQRLDQLIAMLDRWIPDHFARALRELPERSREFRILEELFYASGEDNKLQSIFNATVRLGLCRPISENAPPRPQAATPTVPSTGSAPSRPEEPTLLPKGLSLNQKEAIDVADRLCREAGRGTPDPDALRRAVQARDWKAVRTSAAHCASQAGEAYASELRALVVMASAIEQLATAASNPATWRVCLHAITLAEGARESLVHDLPEGWLDDFVDRIFLALLSVSTGALKDEVPTGGAELRGEAGARLLRALPGAKADAPLVTWCRDAFLSAPRLLVRRLWDWPTSYPHAAESRAGLLQFLYERRLWDALREGLERFEGAEWSVQPLLAALQKRETDPSVQHTIGAIASRLDARAKPGLKALRIFVSGCLKLGRDEKGITSARLGDLERNSDGEWTAVLHIDPNRRNPPMSIVLDVSESCGLRFPDGRWRCDIPLPSPPLLEAQDEELCFVSSSTAAAGGTIIIPYRIESENLTGNRSVLEGQWTVGMGRNDRYAPAGPSVISRCYPGLGGNTLPSAEEGFIGRDRQLRYIDALLSDPRRPGSSLLIGVRRIGKTSLMLNSIRGRLTRKGANELVVFIPLEKWNWPRNPLEFTRSFFDKVTHEVVRHAYNRHLPDMLGGPRIVEELARDLPETDDVAELFEVYADRICERTRGRFQRIYFFIDEFDKLVEPFAQGPDDRVRVLLSQLRHVVGNSKRVGLLLACSPIARPLIDDKTMPLYGSIGRLEVPPFSFSGEDRAVCRQVIVRRGMDDYLQLDDEVLAHVVRSCGGVPYFMTMLAASIATHARRRKVTVPAVNYAIGKLVGGDVPGQYNIDSSKFLQGLQPLDLYGGERTRMANLLLFVMSRRVNLDFPLIPQVELLEEPVLRRFPVALVHRACDDVIDAKVLDRSSERQLRFSSPIVGEAMRLTAESEISRLAEELTRPA
jgi:hypothetical protein